MRQAWLPRVVVVMTILASLFGEYTPPAHAQSVVATIPVGFRPGAIVVNIATHRVYVARQGSAASSPYRPARSVHEAWS